MSDDELYKQKYLKYKKKYLELKELQGGNLYLSGKYVFFLTTEATGYLPPGDAISDFNKFTDNIGNCCSFLRIGNPFVDIKNDYNTIYKNRGMSSMFASRTMDTAKVVGKAGISGATAIGNATISGAKAVGNATVAGVNMARNSAASGLKSASNYIGDSPSQGQSELVGGNDEELVGGSDEELVGGKHGCNKAVPIYVSNKELRVKTLKDIDQQKASDLAALANTGNIKHENSQIVKVIVLNLLGNVGVIQSRFDV